ncbi:hypothetical protein MLD38_015543 [Melastoma candidum]|uniref:Uncharacterized protein n=1 Tax=Melastoma candidum TaxID=119954 RepID=A0ACB9RID1_9MYRT|nr:hypothetical protein MLD38_015543 [Melastoma candidum]
MAFTGTLDKCNACGKTVYVVDMMSLEGMPYHKNCFRCTHCNGHLVMSNYCAMDGVLYCKPHYEQLFKEAGNYSKNFQQGKPQEKQNDSAKEPSKVSAMFSGTQDKCSICTKTVYPLEKVSLEGECYHKNCFRCAHAGCALTQSSYAALEGVLYCKHHFARLFMEKGDYDHVLKSTQHRRASSSVPSTPPPEPVDVPQETDKEEVKAEADQDVAPLEEQS